MPDFIIVFLAAIPRPTLALYALALAVVAMVISSFY